MPNYASGKIYSLRSHKTDEIYIGSCVVPLYKRFANHRSDYNRYLEGKYHYVTSYKLLQYDDCYIELIEEFQCENREQLNKREGEIIRETNNCINKRVEGRTKKQYCIDTKDKKREYDKKRYEQLKAQPTLIQNEVQPSIAIANNS